MEKEELEKIVFLLEHGFYDIKVMILANKNKADDIDYYQLRGDEVIVYHDVVYHDDGICGYYGQNITLGRDLLKQFRKEWLEKNFPEIKKLLKRG